MAQTIKQEIQNVVITPGETISLSVVAGNGHISSSTIKFMGTTEIIEKGEIKDKVIGADIEGKTLRVATRVLKHGATEKIIITNKFKNTKPLNFPIQAEFTASNFFFTIISDYKFVLQI